MAEKEKVIKLKLEGSTEAGKSLSELKKEFKEQQKELQKLEVGSKEYVAQLKKLGELRDNIGDLNTEINALGSNSAKLQAVGKVAQGIAGSFSAATGAASLFGNQSEEVEQALLKVQSALAIQQGISSILELGDAFKVLRTVILANPILILATVIGGIITYFVGLENIIGVVKDAFSSLGDVVSSVLGGISDFFNAYVLGNAEAMKADKARQEQLQKEAEIISKNISAINEQIEATKEAYKAVEEREKLVTRAYDNEIKLARASGENTEQLEKDKLEFVRKSVEEKIKLQIKEFELTQKLSEEILALQQNQAAQGNNVNAQLLAAASKAAEDQKKENKKVLDDLKIQLENTNIDIEVAERESLKRRQDDYQKYLDEKKRADEAAAKARQMLIDEEIAYQRQIQEDAKEEYLNLLKEKGEEEVVINFDVLDAQSQDNEAYASKEIDTLLQQNEYEKTGI